MKYAYFCSKCNLIDYKKEGNPNKHQKCPDCDSRMIYTGYSKEQWESMQLQEQDEFLHKIENDNFVVILRSINNNLSTIKSILVFYLTMTILGIIAWIVLFALSAL